MGNRKKAQVGVIAGLAGVALLIGGSVSAVAVGWNPFPQTPVATEIAYAGAPAGDAADFDRASAIQTAAADKAARDKAAADALAAQQAAEAAAAQAAAEAQAAADAAARAAAEDEPSDDAPAPSGPIKCPAGSQANSGDGGNDTSCFPDICFHITLPDPAHPECVTAFKP